MNLSQGEHRAQRSEYEGAPRSSRPRRNFPKRLSIDTFAYRGSAELGAICALLGRIPTVAEYMEKAKVVNAKSAEIYRYMHFYKIAEFRDLAETVTV